MRRTNSDFVTKYISEAGSKPVNKEDFGFVELDNFTCFVVAESLDNSTDEISAKIVVDSIINDFTFKPTMSKRKLEKYVKNANEQLNIQSTNFKLSASVLVVVSNYQKLRYVSCGNTSLSIFRGNSIFLRSYEQSVYRHMIEENETYEESEIGLSESKNLYNYLGKDGRIKPRTSKKIKLQQDDVLLMSTWGFWHKVSDVEVLDALEDAEDTTTFLGNAQDLLLSKQDGEVGSYTVMTTFINKLYVDKSNKKKYIRIAIIVTIVLLIVLAIVLFSNYRKNKIRNEAIDLITNYETNADTYLEYENYQRAFDQYVKAVSESEKLTKKTGKKGLENTEIKERLENKERVTSLILDGDKLYKDKEYEDAKKTYENALNEINANYDVFSELEIDVDELETKIENCDDEIFLQQLISMGTSEKNLEQYDEAKATLEQARTISLSLGDKASQQEIDLLLKEIASQVKADKKALDDEAKVAEEEAKAAEEEVKAEEEAEKKAQEEEEQKAKEEAKEEAKEDQANLEKALEAQNTAKNKIADEVVISADTAVDEGKYDVAMQMYNNAMTMYKELGNTEKMSEVQKSISAMKVKQADEASATNYIKGDNFLTVGDTHLAKNEFDLARKNYNEALKIFTQLQDKDYMLLVRTKLSDVDSKERAVQIQAKTVEAETYEKNGDKFLAKGDIEKARTQYKLARMIYQEINNIDKVLAINEKIESLDEL